MRRLIALFALSTAVACGDKSDEDDEDDGDGGGEELDCMVEVSLSGEVTAEVSYTSVEGCSSSASGDAASWSWGGTDAFPSVLLWVNSGFDDTQQQQSLSGTVAVMDADLTEWSSESDACSVEITAILEDPTFDDWYYVEGTASCPGPLVGPDGSEVTASTLTFRGSYVASSWDTGR